MRTDLNRFKRINGAINFRDSAMAIKLLCKVSNTDIKEVNFCKVYFEIGLPLNVILRMYYDGDDKISEYHFYVTDDDGHCEICVLNSDFEII